MYKKNTILFGACLVFLLAQSPMSASSESPSQTTKTSDPAYEYMKQSEMFQSVLRDLMLYYVDTVRPEKLVKPALDFMLNKLDPYTVYFSTDQEVESLQEITTGKYGGVGAAISRRGKDLRLVTAYENSPAEKAGLKPGDLLLKIDRTEIDSLSVDKVTNLLRGKVGTQFDLVYKRIRTGDTIRTRVTREIIQIPAVPYYGLIKGTKIGYMAFDNFTQNCSNEVKKAIEKLTDQGMSSLIIDLRGNGGGLVDEAAKIVNFFIAKNKEVAQLRGRERISDYKYITGSKPIAPDLPLVLLIDQGSASASEIMAGALQDYDRALLVGAKTFGKGLVQTIIPKPYDTKLKITTARYYIPSGRCIQILDYSHRNEDGSVASLPDSLRKAFKTSKGRTVYDGGGICPDLPEKSLYMSPIAVSLLAHGYFEDFAINYLISHDTLPNPDLVDLPKSVLDDFEKYVQGKDYSYETLSQNRLKALIEATKSENYYEALAPTLDSLKTKLFHDKQHEFTLHREEIYTIIQTVIYSCYEHGKGKFNLMLRNDPTISKAKAVLSDPAQYESYFSEKKVIK